MATHARITAALLPATRLSPPLLRQGPARQPGPVTQAIRAMRAAEPLPLADAAIEAIREGLIRYFIEGGSAAHRHVHDLRRRIENRIEADLELLEALDGDADREPEVVDASAAEWPGRGAHRFNVGRAA